MLSKKATFLFSNQFSIKDVKTITWSHQFLSSLNPMCSPGMLLFIMGEIMLYKQLSCIFQFLKLLVSNSLGSFRGITFCLLCFIASFCNNFAHLECRGQVATHQDFIINIKNSSCQIYNQVVVYMTQKGQFFFQLFLQDPVIVIMVYLRSNFLAGSH